MLSRSVDPSQATQLKYKNDLTDHDIAVQNNLMTKSIEVDKSSDGGVDYHHEEDRQSMGSDLSKKRIIIRNKLNQTQTSGQALSKLKERYAPGSIKRLRKATIDTYNTPQKVTVEDQESSSRIFSRSQIGTKISSTNQTLP